MLRPPRPGPPEGATSLSQDVADLQLDATPSWSGLPTGVPPPAAAPKDRTAIQARHGSLRLPTTLATFFDFTGMLKCLGCAPESSDPWHKLGLSPPEGPGLSLNVLESRTRFVWLLGSAIGKTDWDAVEKRTAAAIADVIPAAGASCRGHLDAWRLERSRAKPSKLPLWKELGDSALRSILSSAPLGRGSPGYPTVVSFLMPRPPSALGS